MDLRNRTVNAGVLEESVEELYEHAPCGYVATLPDGTIVKVNETFVEWTGAARDTLLAGAKLQHLLTIGSRIYYETHYAPLLRMQGFANEIAMEVVRQDGRILPVLVNTRQKRDADGTPLFNRVTLFDSTDRRRYERELLLARRKAEQVAKDKADLIAMVSHDIRNPLQAMTNVVAFLERSELTDQQRQFVRLLRSSSQNMLELLNRVLELSKAESSAFALAETPIELRDLAGEVVAAFEPAAREKGLQIQALVADAVPPKVVGDAITLRQILSNLVANAVKFIASGSVTLSIETKELGTDAVALTFRVSDTGVGIAADQIDRIFDEFTQASYETAGRYRGAGLGLAITRKLLALYGSRVRVDSEPGNGSTFSFDLRLPMPSERAGV